MPSKSENKTMIAWPTISNRLVEQIDRWVTANAPIYKPGDSGDQALGVLAYHAGMRHVVATLKVVQARQQVQIKSTSIHTTTQG